MEEIVNAVVESVGVRSCNELAVGDKPEAVGLGNDESSLVSG
jgi:hypothetical protein